ncbi:FixH family protein [Vibrio profundum]|uniref:FixH family protein n=1 Tax=Vibrio profundum TaxID=2910247 RepID=UPI003D0B1B70
MIKPWYQQFWPWFLIILPLTVVIWTIATVIIFSQHSVSLVTDDYYKKGKSINQDLSKLKVAKQLGIAISMTASGKELTLQLHQGQLAHYPAIKVLFAHRTLPDRDFSQLLTSSANGQYRVKLDNELKGPWFIEVSPYDKAWKLQGKINFPIHSNTRL